VKEENRMSGKRRRLRKAKKLSVGVLQARAIVLVDESGKERVTVSCSVSVSCPRGFTVIQINDDAGRPRLEFQVDCDGNPCLRLVESTGTSGVEIVATAQKGNGISVAGSDGKQFISLGVSHPDSVDPRGARPTIDVVDLKNQQMWSVFDGVQRLPASEADQHESSALRQIRCAAYYKCLDKEFEFRLVESEEFEDEVLLISVPVSGFLESSDFVVDSFHGATRDRIVIPNENSRSVALQSVCHSLKDANTGCSRASAPVIKEAGGRCLASLSPDLSKVFLEVVTDVQLAIEFEGFLETLSFIPLRIQIVRVLLEQPAKAPDRHHRTQAHHQSSERTSVIAARSHMRRRCLKDPAAVATLQTRCVDQQLRRLQRQRWSNHLPLSTPTAYHIPAATTRAAVLLAGTCHFQDKNSILRVAVNR
jgi:hypothetical protein